MYSVVKNNLARVVSYSLIIGHQHQPFTPRMSSNIQIIHADGVALFLKACANITIMRGGFGGYLNKGRSNFRILYLVAAF